MIARPPDVTPASHPALHVALLGPPNVTWQGRPLALLRRQARALLYRVAAAAQPVPRDQLCFLLWPDKPDAAARRSLASLLNHLKHALPVPDALVIDAQGIALNPRVAASDVASLAWAAHDPRRERLQRAVALYGGPFLDGFTLPDRPEFAAWLDDERHACERRYLQLLAALVEAERAAGDPAAAIAAAERYLAVDALAEPMHQQLIALYAANGDRAAALAQYGRCTRALKRALGVAPLPATRAVYEAVRDGRSLPPTCPSGAPGDAAHVRLNSPLRTALPAPVTTLIGRDDVVRTACALLGGDVRLLTLTGPGGTGKTRLAIAVGQALRERFADGVVWVPLAPLRDAALVANALVHACGLQQGQHAPRDQLCAFVRDKHLLVILDNLEHLQPVAPLLAELLAAGPQLRLLVTSRVRLNLHAERALPVPPLRLPPVDPLPPPDVLAAQPAVALLLDRARQHHPMLQLDTNNAAELAAICVRLDGLPLALELAAARLRLLSPGRLLRRLDACLSLLTGGPRDLPERQRTLHATIDWSYRLLGSPDRQVLARLAVFAGGWTLDAAQAVCETADSDAGSMLDRLQALLDANLIVRQDSPDGSARFGMLETIREFAAEQLRAVADHARVSCRHAAYYGGLAETHGQGLDWPWVPMARSTLDRDYPNIRAALRWAIDADDGALAARIAAALAPYWEMRGLVGEGWTWLGAVLSMGSVPGGLRATLRSRAALLAYRCGSFTEAAELAASVLADEHAGSRDRVRAGNAAGLAAMELGDHQSALGYYQPALTLARDGDWQLEAAGLEANIGLSLFLRGRLDDAAAWIEASYRSWVALEQPRGLGITAVLQGAISIRRGDLQRAAAWLTEGVERLAQVGELTFLVYGVLGCSALASFELQPGRSVVLFAAAMRQAAEGGLSVSLAMTDLARAMVEQARARLLREHYEHAVRHGQSLSLEQMIALALAVSGA